MKYYVTMKICGKYTAEVEADSVDEAKELASDSCLNADFGELEDIDGDCIYVEDEKEDRLWEDLE